MSTLTPAQIRQRIADAAIQAGFKQTRSAWTMFPMDGSRQVLHKGFSVGIPRVSIEDNQRLGRPAYVHVEIALRWSYHLKADSAVSSYDDAMDEGLNLLQSIMHTYNSRDLSLTVSEMRSQVTNDGAYLIGEIAFTGHCRMSIHNSGE